MKKIIILIVVVVVIFIGYRYWTLSTIDWAEPPTTASSTPTNGSDDPADTPGLEDLIRVDVPVAGGLVTSPLTVTGSARGTWFFEASFPVSLVNWDGLIIAQGVATAQGEWMTEDFVPFTAVLEFEKPTVYPERGALILQKDNPSGLPEYDAAIQIPVRFE